MRLRSTEQDLETILNNSMSSIPIDNKEQVYDLLISLQNRVNDKRKLFEEIINNASGIEDYHSMELKKEFKKGSGIGMIVVLGYDHTMIQHTRSLQSDARFKISPLNIYNSHAEQRLYDLCRSKQHDGAILISPMGIIMDNSINLEIKPGEVLDKYGVENHKPLSKRFDFSYDLGTRHCSAKAASYEMPNAVIYVLSEETNEIRIFENGETIFSPISEEITAKSKLSLTLNNPQYSITKKIVV